NKRRRQRDERPPLPARRTYQHPLTAVALRDLRICKLPSAAEQDTAGRWLGSRCLILGEHYDSQGSACSFGCDALQHAGICRHPVLGCEGRHHEEMLRGFRETGRQENDRRRNEGIRFPGQRREGIEAAERLQIRVSYVGFKLSPALERWS